MMVVLIILGLCLVLEGLFSGSEIALVAADKVKLRLRAEANGLRGRVIQSFLDDPGQLISAALAGTNICVVLSTVVATLTLLQWFPHRAELLSLAVMTPLVLIFGEIVPKSVFQAYADRLAPKAIYALWFFRLLVFPIVAGGSWVSKILLRLVGLEQERAMMGREELSLLLRLPSREGEDRITADEKQMVSRIFTFRNTTVEQVMQPLSEMTALPMTATLVEVAREVADKQHTRIPLYRDRLDQIEGIVHAYDVLRAGPHETPRDLCRPAIFVPESQLAVDTLVRLQRAGHGLAIVVDEYGGATGLVAVEDILEEIVGEIEDEYDETGATLVSREPDGSFRIIARAPVERINELLKLNLPSSEDFESMGGLVLDQLKRIPRVGDEVEIGKVVLTITKATERSVEEVNLRIGRRKVTRKPPKSPT